MIKLKKMFSRREGSGTAVTNNKIKDIAKVISSLENSRIFLKGTTRKFSCQEGGFPNLLLRPLTITP